MRIAIIAESFLPQVNGVTNSVRHLIDHLVVRGHQAMVVAPGPGDQAYVPRTATPGTAAGTRAGGPGGRPGTPAGTPVPVVRVRSMPLPMYPDLPLGLPDGAIRKAIREFEPDVIHLASPVVLGMSGLKAAERAGVPTVAVYQTDVVGFAQQYGFVGVERTIQAWTRRVYARADRTLVPSSAAAAQLAGIGVRRIHRWPRGVDLTLFHPSRRDPELRRRLAPDGRCLVGYVGRVAVEKRVELLRHIADLPGVRLVVVGDGPALAGLRAAVPDAVFLGMLGGTELARAVASLDIFVHTGAHETFCQAAQEALASGVPVVAPAAGGLLDLVDHGRTGLLYPAGNTGHPHHALPAGRTGELTDGLRSAVRELAGDPDRRTAMSAVARASVRHRGWEPVLDDLVNTHYRAVLRRSGAAGLVA